MKNIADVNSDDILTELNNLDYADDDLQLLDDEDIRPINNKQTDDGLSDFYMNYNTPKPQTSQNTPKIDLFTERTANNDRPLDKYIEKANKLVPQSQTKVSSEVTSTPVGVDDYLNRTTATSIKSDSTSYNSTKSTYVQPKVNQIPAKPNSNRIDTSTITTNKVNPQGISQNSMNKKVEINDLNQLFSKVSSNVKGASEIVNRNAEIKKKIEERFEELRHLQQEHEENKKKEKEAFEICQQKIKKHKLDMNLLDVEYKFDNSKILFFFTADGRIDFRELVKDLAAVFKTRIELRQIGVRDEVKRIGGNGVCGRELCCCSFLGNFETVSIKMAKEQNISLNPSKISGNCGRLMCCLKYEQDVYEDKLSRIPKVGSIVKTEDGEGIVESIETLKEIIRVKLKDGDETFYKKFNAKDVTLIKSPENEEEDPEEKEHLKELQELEKLEKMDTQNKTDDDI